MERRFEYL